MDEIRHKIYQRLNDMYVEVKLNPQSPHPQPSHSQAPHPQPFHSQEPHPQPSHSQTSKLSYVETNSFMKLLHNLSPDKRKRYIKIYLTRLRALLADSPTFHDDVPSKIRYIIHHAVAHHITQPTIHRPDQYLDSTNSNHSSHSIPAYNNRDSAREWILDIISKIEYEEQVWFVTMYNAIMSDYIYVEAGPRLTVWFGSARLELDELCHSIYRAYPGLIMSYMAFGMALSTLPLMPQNEVLIRMARQDLQKSAVEQISPILFSHLNYSESNVELETCVDPYFDTASYAIVTICSENQLQRYLEDLNEEVVVAGIVGSRGEGDRGVEREGKGESEGMVEQD